MPWTPPDPDAPLRIAHHLPRQAARRRPGCLQLPPHQSSRRPRPPYRGLCRPPYPIIDERIPFHPLPSLDIWADPHPMRKPRLWEWKDWTDALEHLSFATGTSPSRWHLAGVSGELRTRRNDFDLIQDNQTLGWGILKPTGSSGRSSKRSTTRSRSTASSNSNTPAPRGKIRQASLVRLHQDADPGRTARPGSFRCQRTCRTLRRQGRRSRQDPRRPRRRRPRPLLAGPRR